MDSFFLLPGDGKLHNHFTTHLGLFTISTKRSPSQQPPNRLGSGDFQE
jgi:hypothetical protein